MRTYSGRPSSSIRFRGLSQTFPDQRASRVRVRDNITFGCGRGISGGRIPTSGRIDAGSAERNSSTNRARKNFATGPVKLDDFLEDLDGAERTLRLYLST